MVRACLRLRSAARVGTATLIAGLAGCSNLSSDGKEPSAPVAQPTATGLTLVLTSKVAPRPQPTTDGDELVSGPQNTGLLIAYTVTNTGSAPVLLQDRIPVNDGSATGPGDKVDPLKAFVLAGQGTTIDVVKRTFLPKSAPGGPDYTVYFQATVVPAGKTVEGRAFVPLPLTRHVPGFAADAGVDAALPTSPTGWRFCLGVTPKIYEPDVLPGGKYALVANGKYAGERAQRMLCSKPQPLPAAAQG